MTVFEAARQVDCVRAAEILGLSLKRSGSKAYARCLFHAEKSPSLCLYPGDGGFYCFGCHESGDAIALYGKALGLEPLEAAKRVCADFCLSYDSPKGKRRTHSSPAQQPPAQISVHALGKQIDAWRERHVDALLKQKRSAEAAMLALEEQFLSDGRDPSTLWDDARWTKALTTMGDAQVEIDRLDDMTLPELYQMMKEESYESSGRSVSAGTARAG